MIAPALFGYRATFGRGFAAVCAIGAVNKRIDFADRVQTSQLPPLPACRCLGEQDELWYGPARHELGCEFLFLVLVDRDKCDLT